MVKAADVDWSEYFYKIKSHCPWSWSAWQNNLIDVGKWQGKVIDLEPFQARVYIVKGLNPRKLKKLCQQLDQGCYEWLWSHPKYGAQATPVFCLIQQDRTQLNSIRSQMAKKTTNKSG